MNFDDAIKAYDSMLSSFKSIINSGEVDLKFLLILSIMVIWSVVPLFKFYDLLTKQIDRRKSSRKEFISSIASLYSMIKTHPEFLVKKEFERIFNHKASIKEIDTILMTKEPLKIIWLIKHNPNKSVSFSKNGFLYSSKMIAFDRNMAIYNLIEWKNHSMYALFINLCGLVMGTGLSDFFHSKISINTAFGLSAIIVMLCYATIHSLNYIKGISHIIELFSIGDIKYMNINGVLITHKEDRIPVSDLKKEDYSPNVASMIVLCTYSLFGFNLIYTGISLLILSIIFIIVFVRKRSKFIANCLVLMIPVGVIMAIVGVFLISYG